MSAGQPQGGHWVVFTLHDGGRGVWARVVCDEMEGADCRDCCVTTPDCWDGQEHPGRPHCLEDVGECLAVQWLDGELGRDHSEAYAGLERPAVPGSVDVTWDGGRWTWDYPQAGR